MGDIVRPVVLDGVDDDGGLYHETDYCERCGWLLEYEDCWSCWGEGDYHDCGEDSCCCLYPEADERWPCEECDGKGGWLVCPNKDCRATTEPEGVGES